MRKLRQFWTLPSWCVYTTFSIIFLLISDSIATQRGNFVIADFWRWVVVHIWAEAFFKTVTTVLIGYFMIIMGFISKQAAIRGIYLANILFLGSGMLDISHNFYWNAKRVVTMALKAIFLL